MNILNKEVSNFLEFNGLSNYRLLPVEERLGVMTASNICRNNILEKIRGNYALYDKEIPWKGQAIWKSGKILCQYIEEAGLLAMIEGGDHYRANALVVLDNYLNNNEDVGEYNDLFLADTALAVIYMLEYFDSCLASSDKKKLINKLRELYQSLWEMVCSMPAFDSKNQERLAWNHSLIVHAVMGLCAIKLQVKGCEARLDRSVVWVEGYLSFGLTPEGFCREGVFYAGFSRMPLMLFLLNLKKYYGIDFFTRRSLKNHWKYLINEWRVGTKTFLTRNDSPAICSTNVSALLLYAHLCDVPIIADFWHFLVGDLGSKTYGNPRLDSNRNGSLALNYLYCPDHFKHRDFKHYVSPFKFYQDVGVVTGYSADRRKLKYSVQASPHFSSIHSQADHGHLYLSLDGDALLTDTEASNSRAPASPSQSEGHNSLLINNTGMALAGRGWQTASVMESVLCEGDFHIARMNLTPAYNAYRSRIQLAAYQRLFIARIKEPCFFIALDEVVPLARDVQSFCYRFHTDKKNEVNYIEESYIRILSRNSRLDIIPLGLSWKEVHIKDFEPPRTRYADCRFLARKFLGGYILLPYKNDNPVKKISFEDASIVCKFVDTCISVRLSENEGLNCLVEKKDSKEEFNFYF